MSIDKLYEDVQNDAVVQLKQLYGLNKELIQYFKNIDKNVRENIENGDADVISNLTIAIEQNIANLSKLKYEIYNFDEAIPDKCSKEWHKNLSYVTNEMSVGETVTFLENTLAVKEKVITENQRLKLEAEKRRKLEEERKAKAERDRLKRIEEEKQKKLAEEKRLKLEAEKRRKLEEKRKQVEKEKIEQERKKRIKEDKEDKEFMQMSKKSFILGVIVLIIFIISVISGTPIIILGPISAILLLFGIFSLFGK